MKQYSQDYVRIINKEIIPTEIDDEYYFTTSDNKFLVEKEIFDEFSVNELIVLTKITDFEVKKFDKNHRNIVRR